MEFYQRELFLARIKSGTVRVKVDGKTYIVGSPSADTEYGACEIYTETYHQCLEDGIMTDDDVYDILVERELWTDKQEHELNTIVPGHIDYWKVELFNSFLKSETKKKVRKYLAAVKEESDRLYTIRHQFDQHTCAGIANFMKTQYVLKECTPNVDWSALDFNKFLAHFYRVVLTSEQIRELSRTMPWSNEWSGLKKNGRIFDQTNLSPEQKALIMWSSMYDNIHESPDCPPDDIIADDDCLDGWLIVQRRKREAARNQTAVEDHLSKNPKISGAQEVFVPAETAEDAKRIQDLNPAGAQRTVANRLNQIKEHGNVKHHHLSDIKRERHMQQNQAAVNTIRNA